MVGLLLLAVTAFAQDAPATPTAPEIRAAFATSRDVHGTPPKLIQQAFVAGSDRTFYQRYPAPPVLTQEIARWFPKPGENRTTRFVVAVAISQELTADETVIWFVNGVFLGQSCFGAAGAATVYFGKALDDLDLHEAAFLAALPPGPAQFNPIKAPERSVARRNYVLAAMAKAGFVTEAQAKAATALPLVVKTPLGPCPLEHSSPP